MLNSYVYILASRYHGTLYIGVTSDLIKRIWEHKQGIFAGFSKKYNVKMLVYYEIHEDIKEAIKREKVLKGWTRDKKIALIEQNNERWLDLYHNILK